MMVQVSRGGTGGNYVGAAWCRGSGSTRWALVVGPSPRRAGISGAPAHTHGAQVVLQWGGRGALLCAAAVGCQVPRDVLCCAVTYR